MDDSSLKLILSIALCCLMNRVALVYVSKMIERHFFKRPSSMIYKVTLNIYGLPFSFFLADVFFFELITQFCVQHFLNLIAAIFCTGNLIFKICDVEFDSEIVFRRLFQDSHRELQFFDVPRESLHLTQQIFYFRHHIMTPFYLGIIKHNQFAFLLFHINNINIELKNSRKYSRGPGGPLLYV